MFDCSTKLKEVFLRPGLPSASSLSSVGPGEGESFPILTDYPWFHGTLSRSEAAAMVSAGIVPYALGTDGGGSVRIPASLTGLFGIKASFGRVPVYPVSAKIPMAWIQRGRIL